jgi:hypothetical protein
MRSSAAEQPLHVRRYGRVAAEQTVRAESPEVSQMRDRFRWQFRGCILVSETGSRPIIQQAPQLAGIEAGQGEVKAHLLEIV